MIYLLNYFLTEIYLNTFNENREGLVSKYTNGIKVPTFEIHDIRISD